MYLQSYRLLLITPFSLYVSTSSVVSVHILPDKPMAKKPTEVIEENCEFTADCSFDHMRKENILLQEAATSQESDLKRHQSVALLSVAADFIKAFHKAREEPTKKYAMPQTESQEIGWLSTALVK